MSTDSNFGWVATILKRQLLSRNDVTYLFLYDDHHDGDLPSWTYLFSFQISLCIQNFKIKSLKGNEFYNSSLLRLFIFYLFTTNISMYPLPPIMSFAPVSPLITNFITQFPYTIYYTFYYAFYYNIYHKVSYTSKNRTYHVLHYKFKNIFQHISLLFLPFNYSCKKENN